MEISSLGFDPRKYLVLAEAPVFPEPVSWQSLEGAFARSTVNPRHGHLQQVGHFVDRQEMAFVSFFFRSGRGVRGIVWRVERGCLRE